MSTVRYTAELRFSRLSKTARLYFGRLLNVTTQTQTEVIFIHHERTLTFDLEAVNDLMRRGLCLDDLEPGLVRRIVDLVVHTEHPVSPGAIWNRIAFD